jgi:POT family proton-dependent oligopeptide transporter
MTDPKSPGLLRSFPRVFWVANLMELFERAAYYGLNSVLAIYLSNEVAKGGLGFSEQSVGFLQSLVYALTYVVPILGGALADRYGYRRTLLFAFALLSSGYFISGHVSTYGVVFASLLVMALGAGLFKPIISGTLARSTNESNSGFGFGIYYWVINLGAFVAPLVVSWLKGISWSLVFTASSLYTAAMFLPAIFLYRDPPRPQSTKPLREVLAGAALVLSDARFMLMIVVYSGFWILYFQNFGSVLWYLRDFVDVSPVDRWFASLGLRLRFGPELVTSINAGTIILLQVAVSRIVKNLKPVPTMVGGMLIGALGFLCLAFARNAWLFALSIAISSIGEMTAHPKYYSYIGLVAPSDRKAVYMGYSFLYGVIGTLVGSNLGGVLYQSLLKPLVGIPDVQDKLRNFWLMFAGLGAVATFGLVLYNRFLAADTPETNRQARRIMIGVYALLAALGIWFLYASLLRSAPVNYKTMIQALIMLLLGGGGLATTLRHRHERAAS